MPQDQGAKFIARNRAPRVQIEYDVELYGAAKKIQLPFIMGVLANLAGKPADPAGARRRSQVPRDRRRQLQRSAQGAEAAGRLHRAEHADRRRQSGRRHDLREPGRLRSGRHRPQGRAAARVCWRRASSSRNLLSYMDGKDGAEALIAKLLHDPALREALADRRPSPRQSTAQA